MLLGEYVSANGQTELNQKSTRKNYALFVKFVFKTERIQSNSILLISLKSYKK